VAPVPRFLYPIYFARAHSRLPPYFPLRDQKQGSDSPAFFGPADIDFLCRCTLPLLLGSTSSISRTISHFPPRRPNPTRLPFRIRSYFCLGTAPPRSSFTPPHHTQGLACPGFELLALPPKSFFPLSQLAAPPKTRSGLGGLVLEAPPQPTSVTLFYGRFLFFFTTHQRASVVF